MKKWMNGMNKKTSGKKILAAILMVAMMFSMLPVSFAGTSTTSVRTYPSGGSDVAERLRNAPEFKFWNHHNGIWYGTCPVYTAPSEDAFRCANGKAACDTNYYMSEAGYVAGWLLVRYETNNGGVRVGYIPPRYIRGFKSEMQDPQFEYIPVTAAEQIAVTDNPMLPGSSFAVLDAGEEFYVLGKYTYYGDWWYIECTVDGQLARGFIDRSSSSMYLGENQDVAVASNSDPAFAAQAVTVTTLGNPTVSPLGTEQIGEVKIGYGKNGDRKMVRRKADAQADVVSAVYPGKSYPCYAIQIGATGKDWYYIWVEEDSAWGWVSSGFSTFSENAAD